MRSRQSIFVLTAVLSLYIFEAWSIEITEEKVGTSQLELVGGHSIIPTITVEKAKIVEEAIPRLMRQHGVITAGIGVIKNGQLAWTGYFGEQSPGLPASENTRFNIASITKTITAETILRLVDSGKLSLDEPMSNHWLDPDIADNKYRDQMTARMALNHTTGFPNWRFLSDVDGTFDISLPLRFKSEPGTLYTYSGEGLEYVARYAEKKLDRDFESLVIEYVYQPLAMNNTSFSVNEASFKNLARAEDANGVFHGYYCRPSGYCRSEGEWSAADDMNVTIPDHAKFLISVMSADGYSSAIAKDRNHIQVEMNNVPEAILVLCDQLSSEQCPEKQGYGLGWEVADYGDYKLLSHVGSDWSEVAVAYFYTNTKDGLIIFLNGPNSQAVSMMPDAIELMHPESPIRPHYIRP